MTAGRRPALAHRILAITAGLAIAAAGCGISGDGSAQPVDVGLGLDDTLPTTSTSTTAPGAGISPTTVSQASSTSAAATSTTIVLTEAVQLFFISGGRLTYVPTPLVSPATLSQVIAALQAGVSALGAPGVGLRSAVPPASRSVIDVTDNGNGNATVDLPPEFFDVIPQTDQRLAIAQLVLTLTNQRGVGTVQFESLGEPIPVPLGSGELSERGQVLSKLDYMTLTAADTGTTSPTSTAPASTTAPTPDGGSDATTTTEPPSAALGAVASALRPTR